MRKRSGNRLQSEFLLPEIISKISRLGFTRKKISEGSSTGSHSSPYRGYSSEFSSFRPYVQGDDIRYLDWKVYARCERFYIRQFEQETNMRACIVMDRSASMDFKSCALSKFDFAKIIASTLAYILIKRGDSMAFSAVSSGMDEFYPASRSAKNLMNVLNVIERLDASGKTDISGALDSIGPKLRRRTLMVLISDMLTDTEGIMNSVRRFIKQKHNFIVFQVLDPVERNLPARGRYTFVDCEKGDRVTINVEKSAAAYRRQFSKFTGGIEKLLKNCGSGYFCFNTASKPEDEIPEGLFKTGFSME